MTNRAGAALALVLVALVGTVAFLAGGWVESRRLSPLEREEVTTLVQGTFDEASNAAIQSAVVDYLRDNPDALASAAAAAGKTADGAAIRDYLLANPEVISEAMAALEQKRAEQEVAARGKAIEEHRATIFNSTRQIVLGNPQGDVTLVEFFDYNCGYCRRALADKDQLLKEDPKLRLVLKEFPVLGPGSVGAAKVAVALRMTAPDKYARFHDQLLSSREPADEEKALAVAVGLGVDEGKLRAAIRDKEVEATIEESYGLATALGINGTPSYVIHDQVVVGAVGVDALRQEIAAARAECKTASC